MQSIATPCRRMSVAFGLALALTLGSTLAAAETRQNAETETSSDFTVGARLQAVDSVTISQAEIAKGSKVSVIKLQHRQGHLASIDVELADGFIARVPISKARAAFRVIDN
ncbi:hypothetical protein [Chondromyces crocatus]|uniref:Uncharacterized protein n=1 Tax=Chondromyces crocatus TaxID=52 RepID=A0A0K1E9T3_CHOCO|nr:hypothetical protein [Chondromyces crocatus]AKT37348.1 uncharacterized protein CMC5_014830 [Chondromyces crocatus]